ncbi:hypothetical protein BDQ17DRAFT_1332374 [Cyathus striatus]|nr:hypothetical protein BDQ17DRAFT_1332374 [Cyathus striatus]
MFTLEVAMLVITPYSTYVLYLKNRLNSPAKQGANGDPECTFEIEPSLASEAASKTKEPEEPIRPLRDTPQALAVEAPRGKVTPRTSDACGCYAKYGSCRARGSHLELICSRRTCHPKPTQTLKLPRIMGVNTGLVKRVGCADNNYGRQQRPTSLYKR